jgi:glycopeptide antibiotics resistance protein
MAAYWVDGGNVVIPAILIVVVVAAYGVHTRVSPVALTVNLIVVFYAAALIILSFFPFPLPPYGTDMYVGRSIVEAPALWVNAVPFATITSSLARGPGWPALRVVLGNLIAYLPLGLLLPVLTARHSWRGSILLGLAISLAIEATQLILSLAMGIPYRAADVDDVLLNVAGVGLGHVAYTSGVGWARIPRSHVKSTSPLARLAAAIVELDSLGNRRHLLETTTREPQPSAE